MRIPRKQPSVRSVPKMTRVAPSGKRSRTAKNNCGAGGGSRAAQCHLSSQRISCWQSGQSRAATPWTTSMGDKKTTNDPGRRPKWWGLRRQTSSLSKRDPHQNIRRVAPNGSYQQWVRMGGASFRYFSRRAFKISTFSSGVPNGVKMGSTPLVVSKRT